MVFQIKSPFQDVLIVYHFDTTLAIVFNKNIFTFATPVKAIATLSVNDESCILITIWQFILMTTFSHFKWFTFSN